MGRIEDDAPMLSVEREALLEPYRQFSKVCNGAAHVAFRQSDDLFYKDHLGRLMSIPTTLLTDHFGTELVESLLPFLLEKGKHHMFVRRCTL